MTFLKQLNPAQQRAASHRDGPMLVVAGAGSGKTRTLTYRIANLLLNHQVAPESILAVTFTNKAAKEMNERIEGLLLRELSRPETGKELSELSEADVKRLRGRVRKRYLNSFDLHGLWMGTFHSMCCRLLRLEIELYRDPQGRSWQRTFSIFDESDAQSLVKDIVINRLRLDEKKFEPRSLRYAISHAKNLGWTPDAYERHSEDAVLRKRAIAEVYRLYQESLVLNNALDFDDLIFMPVLLFQQHPLVLQRWHGRFQHILVDEYQDTNRTQYELIRLLTTGGVPNFSAWEERSVFVVGDADQSIYSFRSADFTILMEFQSSFGDRLSDDRTQTMIKLEDNYRSVANILQVANHLIAHNTERIDKVLRPTREAGDRVRMFCAEHELAEADYVLNQIRTIHRQMAQSHYGHFAILYRTNAQSRTLEESLVRASIPYRVVGGLRFYDRKEVKDILAYLRVLVNPADSLSLLRIINVPRRGIGQSTLDKLTLAAQELGISLWQVLTDETTVKTLAGRTARSILTLMTAFQNWRSLLQEGLSAVEIMQRVLKESGYSADLQGQGTDEAQERLQNLNELVNAAQQYAEENEDPSLEAFLANAALASSLDESADEQQKVTLMTLHAAKGLEFPVVFLVGVEQGLFPSYRSLNDPAALEEERRLMYVGITRAQEYLYLCHAQARRLYGGSRDYTTPSQFLAELPEEYLVDVSAVPSRAQRSANRQHSLVAEEQRRQAQPSSVVDWKAGDRLNHRDFGIGEVVSVMGVGKKSFITVSFSAKGKRILDPRLAPIEPI
ncbi:MAG: UvrD-helicase domain-containing protein [Oscillatoriales cyanobacterium SM2_2_1]|nr:UvrD-helicase domain-containing protein [Oscillatoriales cyanobacterium SM2_2_1]